MTIMISDLPLDLESEILARVPSKSLAKLQTTCKRWYALFKDPKFVKMNNILRKASKEVMFLIDYRVYSIRVNRLRNRFRNKCIEYASIEFTGKLTRLEDSKEVKLSRIFHCNGLILCCMEDFESLVVWNPCTGETMSIKPKSFYQWNDSYAFGCGNSESSCPNYKILRCSSYYCKNSEQRIFNCEIYDFSSDSWRVLAGVTWRIHCSDNVVSLKGNAYWIHFDRDARHNVLLSFNFTTEVFVSMPLPDQSDYRHLDLLISVVKEEHLAVLHHVVGTFLTEMNVWLGNKISGAKEVSWSKFLVVSFDNFRLPRYSSEMTFWVDEENKVVVFCCPPVVRDMEGGDHFYIVGEGLHKQVYKVTEGSWIWPWLLSYVPSLCHIPKAE
ncbi:unnamed protein product [Brassica oleracea]